MCRRVYLIGFLAWIVAFQGTTVHVSATLQDDYLTIYVKMHDAENLEKQGDYAGALAGFKDCYARLLKIHQTAPDWEPALVEHRMDDCKVTIEKLQNQVASEPSTPPPAPPPSVHPTTPPPQTPVTPNTAVNPSVPPMTNIEHVPLPDDVPALKKRLEDVETELQVTKESLRNSQLQVDTYRGQLESINAQLQASKNKQSVDDKVGKLLTENKQLTEKLNQAQKQIDDLKSTNPKSKVAMMQTQLKNLQDQFDESQAANKALQSTITSLQTRLDQTQTELVNANQKLAASGGNNPEYETIKRENEVMRAILTREIQEQAHRDMAKRLYQEEFDNLKIKSKVLQEQLDILASPMTPATTDEERAMLASLKTSSPNVSAPPPDSMGNTLTATANPTGTTTDGSPTTPAPVNPMAPDTTSTGTTASGSTTVASNDTTTPTSTTTPSSTPPTTPDPGSGTTPSPSTPAAPDTTQTTTTSTPPSSPTDGSNTPSSVAPTTVGSGSVPASTPTDTPTVAPPTPPPTTTVTDTTITHGDGQTQQPDPAAIATKARLPDDMRDVAQEASDLFKMKRYDEAAAKYQTIIDKYPECLYAWSNLGVVRFQQGDLDDALKALQQSVKLSPTDSFSYSNLGIVYYEMKQYENAIDALNAAKALDPNDAKIRNYLGCACSQKGWTQAAEKEFLKAIELDPSFGDAHFNLALVYATEKPPMVEMAKTQYKKALDLGIAKDDRLEKLLAQNPSSSEQASP
jgi:tetratricopeptide (TPR) repeat protein